MSLQDQEIRKFPRFRGKFFTWRITTFVDQENRSKAALLVFSSGKREVVKKYLWHKLVWNQLTKIEFELFLGLLKETDYREWNYLKSLLLISVKTLRVNLNLAENSLGLPETSQESYIGLQRVNIEIQREIRRLPKTKKFSGYIRSLAARGKNKLGSSRIELDELITTDYVIEEDRNLFWVLSLNRR
jgi:hypothetical protein